MVGSLLYVGLVKRGGVDIVELDIDAVGHVLGGGGRGALERGAKEKAVGGVEAVAGLDKEGVLEGRIVGGSGGDVSSVAIGAIGIVCVVGLVGCGEDRGVLLNMAGVEAGEDFVVGIAKEGRER